MSAYDRASFEALESLEFLDKEDLIQIIKSLTGHGVTVNFYGKRFVAEIAKRVRPRITRVIEELSVGTPEERSENLLIEGENLQSMVTLYRYRGQVDLIVTDPPYNTGEQFRYNDRWEADPNDPDLGTVVSLDDGSRHTKWMKAMLPRLKMMKAMLKPGGVIAICIDDNELFHLGMMMDEEFGERNRIAIINWQKNYSPKSSSSHVSISTEYVLVYAKEKEASTTGLLDRTESMNARYSNPDKDSNGPWRVDNLTGSPHKRREDYGIQSPFTGIIHYPKHRWRLARADMRKYLEQWGTEYAAISDPNCAQPSLVLKGTELVEGRLVTPPAILEEARKRARAVHAVGPWPLVIFLAEGEGGPAMKRYLKDVKKGRVPMTYWANEDYEEPLILGTQSWNHEESGHSQMGLNELDAIMGKEHGFQTVKPLKLIKKIIQLWCPPDGLIMDPYAGSGTTAHAVLELNSETGSNRRWILIEKGKPEVGDSYARSLTRERIRRCITGERPDSGGALRVTAEPLGGGFDFITLTDKIDAATVLSMKRDELVDVVIASHWDGDRRGGSRLIRITDNGYRYLVGRNEAGEGYFIIWDGENSVLQLDGANYAIVLDEARKAGLNPPYRVYARYEVYQSPNVVFFKIPDKILAHLGLNENSEPFNNPE